MTETDPISDDFQAQLSRLDAVRDLLSEEQYQLARARLEGAFKEREQSVPKSAPSDADRPDQLSLILQSRQVSVSSDASGNVIITGDNNIVLALPPDQAPEPLLRLYYRSLAAECSHLPLGLIHEEFARPGVEGSLTLQSVYTDLDVVSPPASENDKEKPNQRWMGLRLEKGEGGERTPLLQAISQPDSPFITLLGMPGSGKTTFVNYLTARIANGETEELPEILRPFLPVRLALRYAAAYLPLNARQGTPEMLWNALQADIARHISRPGAELLLPYLQRRLAQSGGLVLLDGLDEVPDAGQRRKCLVQALQGWVRALPKCRFLLTARPYAYVDPKWQLAEFKTLALAAFNQGQIEGFIRRWYAAVQPSLGWSEAEAQRRAGELAHAIQEKFYLADMATRPLLLTLMSTLHSHKSRMPEDRADLYEFSVGLLLTRWQEGRMERDKNGEPYLDQDMEKVLGLGETRLRAALEELALRTQRKQRESAAGREEAAQGIPADIPFGEVLAAFSKQVPHDLNPDLVVRYLENRVGLLVGRGNEIYTFPHRSFQEYLAACRLGNVGDDARDYPQRLCDLLREDLDWWREVFLLGVGKQRQGLYSSAVDILNRLVPCAPDELKEKADFHWRAAALGGEAALDLRLLEFAPGNDYYQTVLRRLRAWLVALLEGGHLSARERLQAGDLLGRLGDPRPGVGVLILSGPAGESLELPDIDWTKIPAGPFLMGSLDGEPDAYADEKPQHSQVLPDFWIGRYPVTNAQIRPFVESDGYENPDYWTAEGWAWRQGAAPDFSAIEGYGDKEFVKNYKEWVQSRGDRSRPRWWENSRWGAASRPVVGVTWYEAQAFCAWLEQNLRQVGEGAIVNPELLRAVLSGGCRLRLPSEAEWEKAARGADGRRWPWPGGWQDGLANTEEAKLSETSPVGMFPGGIGPYGLHDMVGDVWEWTRSKWGMNLSRPDFGYPYDAGDGRELMEGQELRVVRGGAWLDIQLLARCAFRSGGFPTFFEDYLGFRLVLSLAPPEF
jgi:formylglycine-generating enzyme required for sulfatase activity